MNAIQWIKLSQGQMAKVKTQAADTRTYAQIIKSLHKPNWGQCPKRIAASVRYQANQNSRRVINQIPEKVYRRVNGVFEVAFFWTNGGNKAAICWRPLFENSKTSRLP